MSERNHSEIGSAMNFVLRPMLAAFVVQTLTRHFGADDWWRRGVLDVLYDDQKRFLPHAGDYAELTDALDFQLCLLLIDIHWRDVFSTSLPRNYLNYVMELKGIRNTWAHNPEAFDDAATIRALDTMALVSEAFDEEATEKLRALWSNAMRKAQGVMRNELVPAPLSLVPSWRDVMEPNPDVAGGKYSQAEFAADLGQVINGKGRAEYSDPVEFFSRTYLTGGLKTLLVKTLKRLALGGNNGEPVIQLKTSFGGGKTHSLLALYHLFGGRIRAEQSKAVGEVLNAAEVSFLPKVHMAVIVGTWENPLRKTLWGQIATQLSESTGKPELYEMIRENDAKRMSPGVQLLTDMFDAAGACLILIDELVAYARKVKTGEVTDGGTFGNLMTFIQELSEAAKASERAAVVVSIPESDKMEVIDEAGIQVRRQIENYFGRVEFVWTPIQPEEGYEIVRRRLFKQCRDESAREKVCAAFFSMYVTNPNDFPGDSRQPNYREKLLACYPIHPQIFDYLYGKWTNIANFQRTRGVLRLMANVIYHLWTSNDTSPLIMPGNIPLAASEVRDEFTKFLGGNWDAIINTEVDGERSKPYELDAQNPRYGRFAATRKIARTIFLGTAPGSRQGDVRGVDEQEIRLGVIQLQEVDSIAVCNDALAKLKANLYYLYSKDARFWFGVNPTLRKLVDDKRGQIPDDDIEREIEQQVGKWQGRGQFKAVHACPKSSADVLDEQTARLVILSPRYPHIEGQKNNPATATAKDILENCGTVPRKWRNMLLFMAADFEKLYTLKDAVRNFMAWRSVKDEARYLNLDTLQREDAKNNFEQAEKNFAIKTSQAYCKIFVPEQSETGDLIRPMHVLNIDCTKGDNITAASDKFVGGDDLLCSLGGEVLRKFLDKFLWRDVDAIKLSRLWEYFATYYYLPRLVDVNALLNAVRKGVASKAFALAEDYRDGKYLDLEFGDISVGEISLEYLLVKADVAQAQLNIKPPEPPPEEIAPPDEPPPQPQAKSSEPEPPPLPKHFSMDAELDSVRYSREIKRYIGEIASPMMNLPNAKMSIHVDINISIPEGVPADVQELVTGICSDLGVGAEQFHFES